MLVKFFSAVVWGKILPLDIVVNTLTMEVANILTADAVVKVLIHDVIDVDFCKLMW